MNIKRTFITKDFTISQEQFTQGWTMPYLHYHDAYEIYILESGERTVIIDKTEYTVHTYDATLFEKNILHKSKGDLPFTGICIHIVDMYLDAHFSNAAKKHLLNCFNSKIISLKKKEFDKIKEIADGFSYHAPNNFIYLADILNILNLANSRSFLSTVKTDKNKKQTKAQILLSYVNDNYTYIKNIKELMELFDVSERYIFKIIKQTYDMTPKQYINKLKIRNARHRLKYTNATIHTIALDCGFGSCEYFIRVFKKEMQCTPSEFRQNNTGLPS